MRARDSAVSRPAKVPRAPLVPPPIRIWRVPPGAGFGGSSAPGGRGSRSRAAVRGRELCSTVPRVQRARAAWSAAYARARLITGVKLRVNDEPGTGHVRGHLPCDPRFGRNPSPPEQNRCARSRLRDIARRSSKPVRGAACAKRSFRGGRWIAAFRRITSSRSGDWARPGTTEADARQGNDDHRRGMTIADRAVLVTAGNRGIGPELVREALRRSAKCMRLDWNWKVDISQ